jgi:hypothetical protein
MKLDQKWHRMSSLRMEVPESSRILDAEQSKVSLVFRRIGTRTRYHGSLISDEHKSMDVSLLPKRVFQVA